MPLFLTTSIQFTTSYLTALKSSLILSSIQNLILAIGVFLSFNQIVLASKTVLRQIS